MESWINGMLDLIAEWHGGENVARVTVEYIHAPYGAWLWTTTMLDERVVRRIVDDLTGVAPDFEQFGAMLTLHARDGLGVTAERLAFGAAMTPIRD